MTDVLLTEMTFNNKQWYLSQDGHMSENYYAPYLTKAPQLEIGQIKGGFIGVRLGNISIINKPNDRFSPFSIFSGGYAKLISDPTQQIPVEIKWQQNERTSSLFDGTMYLKTFGSDALTFLLEDKYTDVDLLQNEVDIKANFSTLSSVSISAAGTTATVISPDHGLSTGDEITVTSATTSNFNVADSPITKIDDNSFSYTVVSTTATEISGTYVIQFKAKKPGPFSFGIVDMKRGLIQKEDGTGTTKGFSYANPQLNPTDTTNRLRLFDDGILVGTTNSAGSTGTTRTATATPTKSGDVVTVTTTAAHGATIGDQVTISGITHDDYNGVFVIIDTPTTSSFSYYNNSRKSISGISGSNNVFIESNYFGVDRVPTSSTIFTRAIDPDASSGANDAQNGVVLLGTAYVSGVSSNGKTLADFFAYIANKLNVTNVNFKNAPNASSINLEQWVTTQTKLIDYAGKIAEGSNYLFEIKNDELTVFDRAEIPDEFITIENKDIVNASYNIPYPAKAFRARWRAYIPNTTVSPAQIEDRPISVMISNTESGKIVDVPNVTENVDDQITILKNIRTVLNKPVINLTIGDVRTDIKVGTRIKGIRKEDGLSLDMMVRTIAYDFSGLTTQVSGDGTISVIEQTSVY